MGTLNKQRSPEERGTEIRRPVSLTTCIDDLTVDQARSPMTPHAILAPALPVLSDSSLPPLPKSSVFLCRTQDLPTTLNGPCSETCWSSLSYLPEPSSYPSTFP